LPFWYTLSVRRAEIHVETSVWGAALDIEPAYFHLAAEHLFAMGAEYEFFVSPVVLEEIEKAPPNVRDVIVSLLTKTTPGLLEPTSEIEYLAGEYVRRGVIPAKFRNDAIHVAYATFYAKDFLVSYNFKHIVGVRRRNLIRAANVVLGYATPEIVSPEELVDV
jgi:hypothetical protein